MNTISFISANYVVRQAQCSMTGCWSQGSRTADRTEDCQAGLRMLRAWLAAGEEQ